MIGWNTFDHIMETHLGNSDQGLYINTHRKTSISLVLKPLFESS